MGSPRFKLLYDIYHMQIMEGDVIRTFQDLHPLFGHYHTAGKPGRNDFEDAQDRIPSHPEGHPGNRLRGLPGS